ncbi:circularly permuted type 2 ATP-grasp protein [Oryzibacter oryziterrae]|uniref:circularly permuted type 2 ATP-grasp protein n=1 Tax=Oryzibacter oryziterrae TaxID=2766474 RepID=UPI001F198969|nr:circularly permuted type 2 ATP-grasp protein [Oryzibacter oryziterrae]
MSQTQKQNSGATEPRPGKTGWVKSVLASYAPLPGAWDEMMQPDGGIRAPWDRFLGLVASQTKAQLSEAFSSAEQHLRDSGVFFRAYDDPAGGERPWPLAPLPLLIAPTEWEALKTGVIQRARLAEAVLSDVYGEGRLIRDGVMPAAVVAGSPNFLRPLVGIKPKGGRHLRFYAVDIGRGPDGRWWVLSDRAQAPSGAGYALENRIAISRALPDMTRNLNVDRLASFFQAFRDELSALNAGAEARVGLLTPGPLNETYFEHAYLARYLGFLLVEGADLTVRDNAVYVRTVSGLKRVDVLWRRLDGDFTDPLELKNTSQIGVPGLVQAIRRQEVSVTNALGSGVIESRALMGFFPALAKHILGEDLLLPNLATWWCGQETERNAVLAGFDKMAIASAFEGRLAGFKTDSMVGAAMSPETRAAVTAQIRARGMDVVGQEDVRLSTMPVWDGEKLIPRPFVLRLFVAATGDGDWTVMPGGFCRISGSEDPRFVSLQAGARTSDVWVLSEGTVTETSLLPQPDRVPIRRTTGTLPSRSADNLFWLARYLERSEASLRLVRALLARLIEAGADNDNPLVHHLVAHLKFIDALDAGFEGTPVAAALATLSQVGPTSGMPFLTSAARSASSAIRDRLAPDAFQSVMEIAQLFSELKLRRLSPAQALDEVNNGLRRISAFAGLASENMNRAMGWRFLDLGRRIERAMTTTRFVRQFAYDDPSPDALDLALELGDSQITYRWRYAMRAAANPVRDLLVLDPANPRSVAFQVERIVEHLETLPATTVDGRPVDLLRHARKLNSKLANQPVEGLTSGGIDKISVKLARLSNGIAERFFTQRPTAYLPEEFE